MNAMTTEAREVYGSSIKKKDWYPLRDILSEPTKTMCGLFYNKSTRGAWVCGRYSAELGLKGFYKVLVKLATPNILIKKAGTIIRSYYRPCSIEVVESSKNNVVLRITEFPEIDTIIECRIAGWMERAVEICGCRYVSVKIACSLTKYQQYTEYRVSWRN